MLKLKDRLHSTPCENCGEKEGVMASWEFGHQFLVCSNRCGHHLKHKIQLGTKQGYNLFDTLGEDEVGILIHQKSWANKYPFSYKTVSRGKQMLRTQVKLLKSKLKNAKV